MLRHSIQSEWELKHLLVAPQKAHFNTPGRWMHAYGSFGQGQIEPSGTSNHSSMLPASNCDWPWNPDPLSRYSVDIVFTCAFVRFSKCTAGCIETGARCLLHKSTINWRKHSMTAKWTTGYVMCTFKRHVDIYLKSAQEIEMIPVLVICTRTGTLWARVNTAMIIRFNSHHSHLLSRCV